MITTLFLTDDEDTRSEEEAVTRGRPRGFDTDRALDAAIVTFWRHGYEGTSVSALTEAMGIGTTSLYAAFGNKAELFQRALARYIAVNTAYVTDALDQPTAYLAAEAFLLGNARAVTTPGRPPGCLSVQGAVTGGDAPEFASLTRNRAEAEARFVERFERAVREGDLDPAEDPASLAAYLITVATGFAVRAADGVTRKTLEGLARRALSGFPVPAPMLRNPAA